MSKLASYIAATAVAALGLWGGLAHLNSTQQAEVAVFLATAATAISPALKAQFDAAGGQLLSVVGVIVGAAVNYLFLHVLHIPDGWQGVILAALQAAQALWLPAIHLNQATAYRGSRVTTS
jgi:hypothetical protein